MSMIVAKQVYLKTGMSHYIRYPQGWQGKKSIDLLDSFFISTTPKYLTLDEIALLEDYVTQYTKQKVEYTGVVTLGDGDILLNSSHEDLDKLESVNGLKSSSQAPSGGVLSIRERVHRIRDQGYYGLGHKLLEESEDENNL